MLVAKQPSADLKGPSYDQLMASLGAWRLRQAFFVTGGRSVGALLTAGPIVLPGPPDDQTLSAGPPIAFVWHLGMRNR
jgi:hypothetical protein